MATERQAGLVLLEHAINSSRLCILFLLVSAGAGIPGVLQANSGETATAIVSLDYCADQYVIKMLSPDRVRALSPDSTKEFSYQREQARDYQQVRPIAEDVIAVSPDLVIRTYGGGPNVTHFFEKLDIPVLQIGYANSIASVQEVILDVSHKLGVPGRGEEIVLEMKQRISKLPESGDKQLLYVTPGGVTGGPGTLVDSMIETAGLINFQKQRGWQGLPLESLAYDQPDMFATAFYGDRANHENLWSAARHPLVRDRLADTGGIALSGATTACGGWFIVDAIEELATHREQMP